MLSLFLQIFFFLITKGDLASLWSQAGCTPDGLISPTNHPYFWRTIVDHRSFIQDLRTNVANGDGMASLSCTGSAPDSYTDSYDNKFHLLWECQDASNCKLPPVHSLCVRTLRKLHPDSEIKLWSSTLTSSGLEDYGIFVHQYDDSEFFADLPVASQQAAIDMRAFMKSGKQENVYSHWSDLFRAAVLYKEGGVYTDLDSIWLRPISQAFESDKWIPRTPAMQMEGTNDVVNMEGKSYFLEGGIMRFDSPGSPYLWHVLETFPKYDDEMADCWACVGPQQLTVAYNTMADQSELPSLVDSSQVFGVQHYRNYFPFMFHSFDPMIWNELSSTDVVAAHLFTATPQGGIQTESTIFHLLRVGGVSQVIEVGASWRGHTEERRNLLSSRYYVDDGSAATGSANIGSGSVTYWYGLYEEVTAIVVLGDVATLAHVEEVQDIFYSTFSVPRSAVIVSVDDVSSVTLAVTVQQVVTAYAASQAAAATAAVAASSVLPVDSAVAEIDIPEFGATTSTFTVVTTTNTQGEHLNAKLEFYAIVSASFDVEEFEVETDEKFYVYGENVECNRGNSVSQEQMNEAYQELFSRLFETTCVFYDSSTAGFYLIFDTFNEALDAYTTIQDQDLNSFTEELNDIQILTHCQWEEDRIDLEMTTTVTKAGYTYTEVEDLSGVCRDELEAHESFKIIEDFFVETIGQQEIGACQLLQECQADFADLQETAGSIPESLDEDKLEDLTWWWRWQFQRYMTDFDVSSLKVFEGRIAAPYGNVYVDTCIQWQGSWASTCDSALGVCSGGQNFGFATQVATSIMEALATASYRHPNCPWGCQALGSDWTDDFEMELSSTETLSNVCVEKGKYFYWENPIAKIDTCVGYSGTRTDACPLSDFLFCSDVDYESGMVIYGNSTWQSHALDLALSEDDNRHPQCL